MSRYSFPLMWNTVQPSTASALGNVWRISARLFHCAFLAMRNQVASGPCRSACIAAASRSLFREITCIHQAPGDCVFSLLDTILNSRPILGELLAVQHLATPI